MFWEAMRNWTNIVQQIGASWAISPLLTRYPVNLVAYSLFGSPTKTVHSCFTVQ